ncbi:MAG: PDZ domain-containing protein, partial [Gemmatimonadales bacterium]
FFGGGVTGLDLAELNEDLAEYFGTDKGALVMKAPRDSTLPLKGGDVIVAIDGRQVESPSHALRILRSYNSGETATLDIMRRQRRMSIDWTVPESHGRMFFQQRHWEGTPRSKVKKESRA